ncbi:hypothetical protein [Granulosicoccus antarcticus]|uniref:hypothetical protein n=1 Tax=Granulosicoccus antarcticus TaxID=437505 RepID=UPI0012FDCEDA|nr:hypothetical protein [Granulosicoccus antarcticus]
MAATLWELRCHLDGLAKTLFDGFAESIVFNACQPGGSCVLSECCEADDTADHQAGIFG